MKVYEIWTKNNIYKLFIGDTLTINKNRKTYSHVSGGVKEGSIPFAIVNGMLSSGQLEQTCKWPLAFKVIEIVKKDSLIEFLDNNPNDTKEQPKPTYTKVQAMEWQAWADAEQRAIDDENSFYL